MLVSEISILIMLFCIIIDPTRNLFHFTEVSFFLAVICNIHRFNYRYFVILIFCLFSYFFSLSFNYSSSVISEERMISLFVAMIFISLIFFSSSSVKYFKYFIFLSVFMSLIVVFLGFFFLYNRTIGHLFISFFSNDSGNIMFAEQKAFLSLVLVSVFYKTSPIVVIALAFSSVCFLETKKKRYLLGSVLFILNLFFSGTRANIVSGLLITVLVFFFYQFYFKKKIVFSGIIILCVSFLAFCLIFILLSQTGEASYDTKKLHYISYLELFGTDYLRTIVLGFGPGSEFFSRGFEAMTASTELSYMELIRNYGLLNAIIIVSFYVYPLIVLFFSRKYSKFEKYSLLVSFLSYLFIAGTNPFLNSMTGYMVLSIFYLVIQKNIFHDRKNIVINNEQYNTVTY